MKRLAYGLAIFALLAGCLSGSVMAGTDMPKEVRRAFDDVVVRLATHTAGTEAEPRIFVADFLDQYSGNTPLGEQLQQWMMDRLTARNMRPELVRRPGQYIISGALKPDPRGSGQQLFISATHFPRSGVGRLVFSDTVALDTGYYQAEDLANKPIRDCAEGRASIQLQCEYSRRSPAQCRYAARVVARDDALKQIHERHGLVRMESHARVVGGRAMQATYEWQRFAVTRITEHGVHQEGDTMFASVCATLLPEKRD